MRSQDRSPQRLLVALGAFLANVFWGFFLSIQVQNSIHFPGRYFVLYIEVNLIVFKLINSSSQPLRKDQLM